MLYSDVYNISLTDDLKAAMADRNIDFLKQEVKQLAAQLARADADYDSIAPRLFISMALLDSLTKRGMTVQFCCDFINF